MHHRDAIELARNIETASYYSWFSVPHGLIYQTCGECGSAHAIMIEQTGPDMCRVRLVPEDQLTAATRENEDLKLPMYREVATLREQNVQFKRLLSEAKQIAESDLLAVGHAPDSTDRVFAMNSLKDWIARLAQALGEEQ